MSVLVTVSQHYSDLLAPVYVWMVGGLDAALVQGESEVASFSPSKGSGQLAVDLGAGFGMHAIPLARRGYSVIAIDTSAQLLRNLRECRNDLPIRTVEADLVDFPEHVSEPADLIVCMGDTLAHLQTHEAVLELFTKVAASVTPYGTFVLTFRDYTRPPTGTDRFIPVRSDADRIFTCFLEDAKEHVFVHDILHERDGDTWNMKISSYAKLRLDPDCVVSSLESLSFRVQRSVAPRGMVRVVAKPDRGRTRGAGARSSMG
jgi:SAM-dependent methyltransferase